MDLKWLRMVLKVARGAWGIPFNWTRSPAASIWPGTMNWSPRARVATGDRRSTEHELERVRAWIGQSRRRTRIPMHEVVDFTIASTRRQAEIFCLRWEDIDRDAMIVLMRDMKSPKGSRGNHVVVKISHEALAIIDRQPRISERIFPYNSTTAQGQFMRACQ